MSTDRIELGRTVRAAGRRDGRRGSAGCVVEALSADKRWHFVLEGGTWTVEHLPSGRVLTHAGRSLEAVRASERWLLAELELHGVAAA